MPDEHLHDIIGRIGALEGTIRTFMSQWQNQDNIAMQGRAMIHEKMEALGHQVQKFSNDLLNVQQDIAEMKNEIDERVMPVVETVTAREHRKKGERAVWTIIVGALVTLISGLAYVADKASGYFFQKP